MKLVHVGALLLSSSIAVLSFGCGKSGPGGSNDSATNAPANAAPGTTSSLPGEQPQQTQKPAGTVAGHSAVPTLSEWSAVGEVTVRNSGSLGCETKMVREWLRVSCHSAPNSDNAVTGVQAVRPTGDHEFSVYQAANIASIVMPVRDGANALVRFTWKKWGTRDLTVSWPHGAPSASMSFDRGADAAASPSASAAAGALQCKGPGECPKGHCCLSGSATTCSATVCGVGAEVCTNNEDCEMSSTLKGTGCAKTTHGVSTCQR